MKRGEIWTLQANGYASKPQPVVTVQNDNMDQFQSIIVCLITSFASDDISTRIRIESDETNQLNTTSYVMTDKVVTVNRNLLGYKIGKLDSDAMSRIGIQLMTILRLSQ
jgi:mRNA interferase MazF